MLCYKKKNKVKKQGWKKGEHHLCKGIHAFEICTKKGVKADAVLLLTADCIAQKTTGSVCFSQMDTFYCALS